MAPDMHLILGSGQTTRVVEGADDLLRAYRRSMDCLYLNYHPITPTSSLLPEDLAVTLLVSSRASWLAHRSLQRYGASVNLQLLAQRPLEQTTPAERLQVADLVATLATWPGFGTSLATKVLHKKRPDLIPILDNQAIFGGYLNPKWPDQPPTSETNKDKAKIVQALESITHDLSCPENQPVWAELRTIEPNRTLIQIFDCVWWMYMKRFSVTKSTKD